jgi:hypothetical protein
MGVQNVQGGDFISWDTDILDRQIIPSISKGGWV